MSAIEINTQQDIDDHFKWHELEREKISDAIDKLLDNCDDTLTKQQQEALIILQDKRDKLETDCYPFELKDDKIEMYVNHEGCCLGNIQYCPFCGMRFIITKKSER